MEGAAAAHAGVVGLAGCVEELGADDDSAHEDHDEKREQDDHG